MIEIDVKCTTCSKYLEHKETFRLGVMTINITPCQDCLDKSFERGTEQVSQEDFQAGYDEGYKDGRKSFEDQGA